MLNERVQKISESIRSASSSQNEIARLRTELREKDNIISELKAEIETLKCSIPQKSLNERGAGRKTKITAEVAAEVLQLHQEGFSFSEIARIYTQNTGKSISKSTVDKITKNWRFD